MLNNLWIFLFVIGTVLDVYLFFGLFSKDKNPKKSGESLFFSFAACFVWLCVTTTVAAIFGFYSMGAVDAFLWGLNVILLLAAGLMKRLLTPAQTVRLLLHHHYSVVLLLLLLAASFLYFLFPTSFLSGVADPGLYLIDGVHIAKSGSMQYEPDDYVNSHYSDLKNITSYSYSGLYSAVQYGIKNAVPGKLVPQFLPMMPAVLAIGYSLAGMSGLVRVDCVIGLLSLLAAYYFTKKIFSKTPALISVAILIFNPAQLWNVRITQTEILAQLLFFLSVYAFAVAWEQNRIGIGILSGLLIGVGLFNRIDVLIFGIAIYTVICYCEIFRPDRLRLSFWTGVVYTGMAALSVYYGFSQCFPYYHDLYVDGSLKYILYLNAFSLVVGILLLLLYAAVLHRRQIPNLVQSVCCNRAGMATICMIFLLLFLFAYYVRPAISPYQHGTAEFFNSNAMVEFCFYVPAVAFPIAILGLYQEFRHRWNSTEASVLFFLIGLFSMVGYILRPSIGNNHIWASRRWVTVSIPFLVLFCSNGIVEIGGWAARVVSRWKRSGLFRLQKAASVACVALLTLAMVAFGIHRSKPFLFQSMMGTYDQQYQNVAQKMDDHAIYLASDQTIASVLHFVYGKNVYLCDIKYYSQMKAYAEKNHPLYYIGDLSKQNDQDVQLISEDKIEGVYLETTIGYFPQKLVQVSTVMNTYKLS